MSWILNLDNFSAINDINQMIEATQVEDMTTDVQNRVAELLKKADEINNLENDNTSSDIFVLSNPIIVASIKNNEEAINLSEKISQIIIDKFNKWDNINDLLIQLLPESEDSFYLEQVKHKVKENIIKTKNYALIELLFKVIWDELHRIIQLEVVNTDDARIALLMIKILWDKVDINAQFKLEETYQTKFSELLKNIQYPQLSKWV